MIAGGWLRRLFGARAETTVSSAEIRRGDGVWESFTGLSGGVPSQSSALAVTAVYSCVQLVAGAISSLPMHIYRRDPEGDLTRDMQDPLWWVLNEEFSPRWPASAGWSFLQQSRMLRGDAFAEILRDPRGRVSGLVPLHPDRVRPVATPDGERLVYEIKPDPTILRPDPGRTALRVLDQDDILHVPGFGFDGLRSLSPLRHALRNAGRLAISAQDFANRFLENMARPDFVLSAAGNLTDDQFAQLTEMIDSHRGAANAGRPLVLEGGLELKPLTMPLEDVQLLETRRFQVEEIARVFGVPPFMIGHTDKTTSWGSGVESMGVGFVRFTLRDHLNAFQNEMNRKFWPRTMRKVAEFDTAELERADTKSMFEALRVGLGRAGEPAFITTAEARQFLRLPKEPPGGLPDPATAAPPADDPAPPPAQEPEDPPAPAPEEAPE